MKIQVQWNPFMGASKADKIELIELIVKLNFVCVMP